MKTLTNNENLFVYLRNLSVDFHYRKQMFLH